MAQGDANKVWIVPSDFGRALEGFAKMLGSPGDDGVFRYQPNEDDTPTRVRDDDAEVADWFDTSSDPEVAAAVRAAEEVARTSVSPLPGFEAVSPQPGMTPQRPIPPQTPIPQQPPPPEAPTPIRPSALPADHPGYGQRSAANRPNPSE
jgi:hypothetical protein